ncbi:glycosyltransferase [Corynebacterium ulceribovis]|uniref:glycosyltransferase n=1 Tax=Corynebacterium ulceribovis TaxID=487732 RepID=UPI00037CF2B7|nr:glycosyltransferase [Corynebacterium ulceribovis]
MAKESQKPAPQQVAERKSVEQLQRVLMPSPGDPHDVRALYYTQHEAATGRLKATSRTSATLAEGSEISFATYFGAFPASYWRRWSQLDNVILRVEVSGEARVDVYRSKFDGTRIAVTGSVIDTDESGTGLVEFDLSLAPFEDGGWLWFDITCETDVELISAGWWAPHAPKPQIMPDGREIAPSDKRVTIGIPTFNRPKDAVAALEALASDPEVDAIIDLMLMPDQGTAHPADEPGFDAITEHFGDRFKLFLQGNLGGSGGYSRIMYEALEQGDSPFILYMDDDIAIEPDSILRAVQAGRYCTTPSIIGGQMLNLLEPSRLHTMGERVNRHTFMWEGAPHVHYGHDFAKYPLTNQEVVHQKGSFVPQDNRDMHRRIDAEFNGWWMCMFPRIVAEEMGQPLPLFIKWDDTEYSLRAAASGFSTITWPGIAIWHMSWGDKDDDIDWQAYFHLRNRMIVAAMYHDGPVDGIIKNLRKSLAKHLMCLEYSTIAIETEALRDFLAGPEQLFDILESSLPRINAMRKEYVDAQKVSSAADLPDPSGADIISTDDVLPRKTKLIAAAKGLLHSLKPANPAHHVIPQANLVRLENRWYNLARLDGATVTTADGSAVYYRKRDRDLAKQLGAEAWAVQKEVKERFDEMRERYRDAMPELTSRESWKKVFDAQ